jgi:hypothetical protein
MPITAEPPDFLQSAIGSFFTRLFGRPEAEIDLVAKLGETGGERADLRRRAASRAFGMVVVVEERDSHQGLPQREPVCLLNPVSKEALREYPSSENRKSQQITAPSLGLLNETVKPLETSLTPAGRSALQFTGDDFEHSSARDYEASTEPVSNLFGPQHLPRIAHANPKNIRAGRINTGNDLVIIPGKVSVMSALILARSAKPSAPPNRKNR